MEILADKYKLDINRLCPNSDAVHTMPGKVNRMVGFLRLTEEDRLKAGVYVGNEGREWIDRSALILFPREPD